MNSDVFNIKCFGIATDIIGERTYQIESNSIKNVGELRLYLDSKFEQLKTLNNYMIAVNHSYALPEDCIDPSDEIAILPPVSGG
ncbi:MAG: MoaD/ThiS family protein [Saprospiraceae bacterium]